MLKKKKSDLPAGTISEEDRAKVILGPARFDFASFVQRSQKPVTEEDKKQAEYRQLAEALATIVGGGAQRYVTSTPNENQFGPEEIQGNFVLNGLELKLCDDDLDVSEGETKYQSLSEAQVPEVMKLAYDLACELRDQYFDVKGLNEREITGRV